MRERLLARWYSRSLLRHSFNKASKKTRGVILYNTPHKHKHQTMGWGTRFSTHERHLRTPIAKNLHFLTEDYTISKYVRPTPELIFRRVATSREQITSSHSIPHRDNSSLPQGTYQCGNCPRCQWFWEAKGIRLNGQWHRCKTASHPIFYHTAGWLGYAGWIWIGGCVIGSTVLWGTLWSGGLCHRELCDKKTWWLG